MASLSPAQENSSSSVNSVSTPFPIFSLASKYLLYDINTITHIRATYNISGVLIGSLPQAPQQNVFLGIPLELMPEEARVLVEKGAAYIVDDVKSHKDAFLARDGLDNAERKAFQLALRKQGQGAAKEVGKRSEERKKAALEKKGLGSGQVENWNDIPDDMFAGSSGKSGKKNKKNARRTPGDVTPNSEPESSRNGNGEESLFGPFAMDRSTSAAPPPRKPSTAGIINNHPPPAFAITPTTSYPPLQSAPPSSQAPNSIAATATSSEQLPVVPKSYPLYKHLHERGYFLSPGLRFGCQYTAYPGDPLRFHSHFLCNGMDWDEEFDLLELVGGGRLGTGVKKGYLIGGKEEKRHEGERDEESQSEGNVRTFCIEWAGM